MEKHKLIDELEKRLMEELKIWAANLPHYSNVYMILDQYSVEYMTTPGIKRFVNLKAFFRGYEEYTNHHHHHHHQKPLLK